uniref:Uncharacterized protein n=1 Tax=Parascaris univalens TaxID=6257 RepID=A0A915CFY4_PARUN
FSLTLPPLYYLRVLLFPIRSRQQRLTASDYRIILKREHLTLEVNRNVELSITRFEKCAEMINR